MSTLEVLLIAWAAGLVLERRGEQLAIRGLEQTTPPQLLDLLREHKSSLLAVMTDQSQKETP